MQVEIKVALNFILSFLYEKLPRRRVNLFGDELQKYLILKFFPNSTNDLRLEKNCLSINFKSFNGSDIIDPCLIAAANTSAINIYEVLACLPDRVKLFIESDLVYYAVLSKNQDEIEEMKIIYDNNKTATIIKPQPQHSPPPSLVNDSVSLNVSLKNHQDFLLNQISSMSIKENSSSSLSSSSSSKQIFTTAAFAQTKFGSTKKKNSNYLNDPNKSSMFSNKPQTNPKIHSNEFSAYIKQHSNLLKSNLETKDIDKKQSLISNIFKAIKLADCNNTQLLQDGSNIINNNNNNTTSGSCNDWTFNNGFELLKQKQQSPVNSSASSSSSIDYMMNSSSGLDELEENMINSYFNPISLNPAAPNFSMPYHQQNQLLNLNDLKFNFENQD